MTATSKREIIPSLRGLALSELSGRVALLDVSSQADLALAIAGVRDGSVAGNGLERKAKERMAAMFFDGDEDGVDYERPYLFRRGVAYIPVRGLLLNRLSFSGFGVTGYDYLRGALAAAMAASDVSGIVFDVDSPGGMVQGNFELCAAIREARGQKSMMALVNATCCSGSYSIASATGNIVAVPSSDVGSIGVYILHADYSKLMDDMGVKMTIIRAGARKVESNPYEPLTEEVRANLQASVDKSYDEFTALVADNRGIEQQAVRDTEAAVFTAEDAMALGLIDSVTSATSALAAFFTELSGSSITAGEISMATEKKDEAGANAAAIEDATKAAVTAAATAAVQAHKERRKAITTCPEAEGRSAMAAYLADETDMPLEQAIGLLKVAPKEAKAGAEGDDKGKAKDTPFEKAMADTPNPNVASEAGDEQGADTAKGASRLIAAGRRAGVRRLRSVASA